jgi:beta-lactamase class D
MKQCIGLILLATIGLFGCTPNNVKSDANIAKILDSAQVNGSFALMENGSAQFVISDLSMYKDSAFAPLQTVFSIPALIALDKGYINHTPSTWVPLDTLSYYQQLMGKIGRTELLKSIDSIHYGKGIVGADLNNFWNDGSLKITPDEQLGFIKKLYFNQLPFQKRSQDIFKKMILREDNANYQLSYILGFDDKVLPTAWVLGYIEENKHPYFFVMHITSKNKEIWKGGASKSLPILKAILAEQGFLKGVR